MPALNQDPKSKNLFGFWNKINLHNLCFLLFRICAEGSFFMFIMFILKFFRFAKNLNKKYNISYLVEKILDEDVHCYVTDGNISENYANLFSLNICKV